MNYARTVVRLVFMMLITLSALNCAAPVFAEQNLNYTSDSWIDARYDYTIYLKPKNLPNLLNYPTSGLHPITDVSVSYRVAPRFQPRSLQQVHYQDLWYHVSRPIGCVVFQNWKLNTKNLSYFVYINGYSYENHSFGNTTNTTLPNYYGYLYASPNPGGGHGHAH